MAVAYDLVLEDHILAAPGRQAAVSAPFGREVAEMVRYAVGYQSRAFVTFGAPIPLGGYDPESRRDVMELAHLIRDAIGLLYKVLPTARGRRRDAAVDDAHASSKRACDAIIDARAAAGANMGVRRRAAKRSRPRADALAARNIIHVERGGRFRIRERTVLRYYARTIQHLLAPAAGAARTH